MKLTILLVEFAFVLTGCATLPEDISTPGTLRESQVYLIDPHENSGVYGDGGTRISIDSGSFETNSRVKVELKEFYNLPDMILNGLSTQTSTGLLSSSGMIKIEFSELATGKKLIPIKPYHLSFRDSYLGDGSSLFSGKTRNGLLYWEPIANKAKNNVSYRPRQNALFTTVSVNIPSIALGEDLSHRLLWLAQDSGPAPFFFELKDYGWINCDRIFASDRNVKCSFRNLESSPTVVAVVLPAKKTILNFILQGRETVDFNLGFNEKVLIIGFKGNFPQDKDRKIVNVSEIREDTLSGDKEYDVLPNRVEGFGDLRREIEAICYEN